MIFYWYIYIYRVSINHRYDLYCINKYAALIPVVAYALAPNSAWSSTDIPQSTWRPFLLNFLMISINPLHAKFSIIFHMKHKNICTIYIITPHWRDAGSWNLSSCRTRTYLFYIVHIMAADILTTQGAGASATMILTMLNNSVPAGQGLGFIDQMIFKMATRYLKIYEKLQATGSGNAMQNLVPSWQF